MTGGNVLLVVEIADSSLRYDIGRKATLYASFGVRDLWVIDAVRLTISLFRVPTADGYRETITIADDEVATPLFAPSQFALRLTDLAIDRSGSD